MSKNKDLQDAREKFFDGPASDYQSFYQFLMQQGRPDLVDLDKEDRTKRATGGLTGNQKKLDKNKDGKITGKDFKMLRNKKSKGGRVKMAEGSNQKVDPQKALDDHAKALKEMQEALRQVRETIFGGKRTEKSKGGRVKLAKGSPNPALMDATSNRATNGPISRGGGAAVRGINFKGIF